MTTISLVVDTLTLFANNSVNGVSF